MILFFQYSFPLTDDFGLVVTAVNHCGRFDSSNTSVDNQIYFFSELFVNQFRIGHIFNIFMFFTRQGSCKDRCVQTAAYLTDNVVVGYPDSYFLAVAEDFGNRLSAFRMKVNGPGRQRFISLNVALLTRAYSLMLLRS